MSADSDQTDEQEPFTLSPSERMGDRAASKIGGADGTRKTQKALASIVLGFELIVVFLVGLTVFGLRAVEPAELGIYGGLAMSALIIVALALMRRGSVGIWIGWFVHLGYFVAGAILLPAIFIGVIFGALWVFCMVKGAQIDRERLQHPAG